MPCNVFQNRYAFQLNSLIRYTPGHVDEIACKEILQVFLNNSDLQNIQEKAFNKASIELGMDKEVEYTIHVQYRDTNLTARSIGENLIVNNSKSMVIGNTFKSTGGTTEDAFNSSSYNLEVLMAEIDVMKSNMNAMYLVIMGSIIIFMQAGFAFLEAGSIRAKNTTNILVKNFVDFTFGTD